MKMLLEEVAKNRFWIDGKVDIAILVDTKKTLTLASTLDAGNLSKMLQIAQKSVDSELKVEAEDALNVEIVSFRFREDVEEEGTKH